MARLVYLDKEGYERSVAINAQHPEVTIGRHPSCMIHTTNATVSRHHCMLRFTNEGCEVVDRGSSSGTFLNSYKITRQLLRHGDEICCGRFPLMFYEDHIQDIPWPNALWGGPVGWLLFKNDNGNERSLRIGSGNPRINIGRQNDCVIQTTDSSVSRVHAEIQANHGHFEIIDLQSANGTRINGQRIQRHTLRSGDEIRCGQGRVSLLFYEDSGVPVIPGQQHGAFQAQPAWQPSGSNPRVSAYNDQASNPGVSAYPEETYVPSQTLTGSPLGGLGGPLTPDNHSPELRIQKLEKSNQDLTDEVDSLKARNDSLRRQVEEANRRATAAASAAPSDVDKALSQKQLVIDNLRQRVEEAEATSRKLEREMIEMRTDLRKKRDESEQLRYKLEVLQHSQTEDDSQTDTIIEENAALKGQLEAIRMDYEEANRLANLYEFELKELKEKQSFGGGGGGGMSSSQSAKISELIDRLNDVISQMRNDTQLIGDYTQDLKTVFDAYNTIDLQYLTSSERTLIEDALKQVNPGLIFEDLEMTTGTFRDNVRLLKDHVLDLKNNT